MKYERMTCVIVSALLLCNQLSLYMCACISYSVCSGSLVIVCIISVMRRCVNECMFGCVCLMSWVLSCFRPTLLFPAGRPPDWLADEARARLRKYPWSPMRRRQRSTAQCNISECLLLFLFLVYSLSFSPVLPVPLSPHFFSGRLSFSFCPRDTIN